ncbi:L-serine ammonia-lyase [Thorsellia anophelis]|uniref:L-serine dehydratase n=1 Tax=Thorsellia anophelis DSM 18579 TaxID=1123402 RepID=A0A1I0E0R8_9GAMM|nr:L-serine ammonia-lyase [Thorsellia anophelis]SET38186.1 L-serine dehydratase [Thorsellia anophelis DSM 18579]
MLSIFDIFKIGVGPSSSHTNGPMVAANRFITEVLNQSYTLIRIEVNLYGSLSLTGRGHHTDKAVLLGLMGNLPSSIDIDKANQAIELLKKTENLRLNDTTIIKFNTSRDVIFNANTLPLHENALTLKAYGKDDYYFEQTYYSVGGGFVYTENELKNKEQLNKVAVPYPFSNAKQLLNMANEACLSLHEMIKLNELQFHSAEEIKVKTQQIWQVIEACVERGIATEGVLSGGLHVQRRAANLYKYLSEQTHTDELSVLDWINLYAFAVSEENADGGQVVTSPTNGAAGVIPAVLKYYNQFVESLTTEKVQQFLMVAGAIGYLYKVNASISGAEVGCQGEIGVSSSMAAAGLTAILGGTNDQMCIAAEIAMEHSLGMTCDPIGGLVQIPCIERNAMGALKAVNASRMALLRQEKTVVSLDNVIETMYKTGKDMNQKYRETSLGGLALIPIMPCE